MGKAGLLGREGVETVAQGAVLVGAQTSQGRPRPALAFSLLRGCGGLNPLKSFDLLLQLVPFPVERLQDRPG